MLYQIQTIIVFLNITPFFGFNKCLKLCLNASVVGKYNRTFFCTFLDDNV